jgi:predicted lipoprotein with Yx(FWY)xxD motif
MFMFRKVRILGTSGLIAAALLVLSACGGAATPAATELPVSTSAATLEATATSEATSEATATTAISSTEEATGTSEATSTEESTATAEVIATAGMTGTAEATSTTDATGTAEMTATAVETSAMPSLGPTVMVTNNATLGNILVDNNGMTLYTFMKDTPGVSNCTGSCLTSWPPLTVTQSSLPSAGPGITGTLSLLTRDDGSSQVMFENMPLYRYAKDMAPGDTNGQGVGNAWYVVAITPTTTSVEHAGAVALVVR